MTDEQVTSWLMAGDPAVRWQAMRDLLDAPDDEWWPERRRVEHEGWGAQLLAHQDADGLWDGGACFPGVFSREEWEAEGQPWTSTMHVLGDLRALGFDPSSSRAKETVRLIGENGRWEYDDLPYWGGEVEECINGRTVTDGVYFGVDMAPLVDRLVGEQQPDGGWNCERANGSTRSSFHSTINVLEGLWAFEQATGGTAGSRAARADGEAYLLDRHLFRRLSTGETADPDLLLLGFPYRWHHTVLRGLDYFRTASSVTGAAPDRRLAEAAGHLESMRAGDGRWPLEWQPRGRVWFAMERVGEPSRWVTLMAIRILRWWNGATVRE
ncbi:MAG TPA: hypothetical protein VFR40_10510 [Lapillicoccus sp.]|nr:hypothetical protein [Lapillicoccus sp.]